MTISFIRTILLYIVIIAAVRLMGKRQISEMQTSELVVTLLISVSYTHLTLPTIYSV